MSRWAAKRPQTFQPFDAPILCPMHLSKAQIPRKNGQITLKTHNSRAFQNWHAPCNNPYISSFGGPGTGRPGEPLFYSQHRQFWGPRYRQAGPSPLYTQYPFRGPWYRQAGISPLLFVQFHLQPPAPSVLCTGPLAVQGARGHHRQQQTFLAILHPPAHRLALQAQLPLPGLALGLEQ